ncbi:hypothetical protein TEA_026940 [Camellia sinensis var. sinensis]|uniref:Uncharacterized protein n=1 Tax=Camellia sinensis var. sinensis TaxID=542762 RepID=A0A4S4F0E8_CAMSN|nr:hypothetical protein TEA_026940 [Camellia sinensis var. sinensis]
MEYPHNTFLLLCSSHDKGCHPYMCGTSSRYSNCLDQYKKAYTKVKSTRHDQASHRSADNPIVAGSVSSLPVEKFEATELACPLCGGGDALPWEHTLVNNGRQPTKSSLVATNHGKGQEWRLPKGTPTYSNVYKGRVRGEAKESGVREEENREPKSARDVRRRDRLPRCERGRRVLGGIPDPNTRQYLNAKKRSCIQDSCSFVGTYKELRKHVREEHPSARPREVDPSLEQKWTRLEREREREDVISTIRSSMPGAMVFGDYVIEGSHYRFDSDEEEDFDMNVAERNEGLELGIDSNLVNVFLLFHAFGQQGILDGDSDNDHGANEGMSLVGRLRRQGRVLLGQSGRRQRRREVVSGG